MRTGPRRPIWLTPHSATSKPTAMNSLVNRESIWYLDSMTPPLVSNAVTCMIMAIRIVQVDAFTNQPFAGNPAAVCVLPQATSEPWMRNVAREMNLSETAFLAPRDGGYDLRWLTPAVEVDLCGHATVASAHVLWQDGHLPEGRQARFHTRSGLLTADRRGDWIELDFPAKLAAPAEAPPELLPALGIAKAAFVGRNAFDYLVEVETEEVLRGLSPDHTGLRKLPVRGIIVTSRSS